MGRDDMGRVLYTEGMDYYNQKSVQVFFIFFVSHNFIFKEAYINVDESTWDELRWGELYIYLGEGLL
jgi:hypothetical protein